MVNQTQVKYEYNDKAHNLADAIIIVPVLLNILKPTSVVDVGCGIGTFLKVFSDYGITDILGLDGEWVDREKLTKNIDIINFLETNLESRFTIDKKFDLALCLEVAEHISSENAELLVENITKLSDLVIFSAAIPSQGGQNHVNEQWPEYWVKKFNKHGFIFLDILRPIFWNNKNLARWYKQNIFLVIKKGKDLNLNLFKDYYNTNIPALVHPEYYEIRVAEIKEFRKNEKVYRIYIDSIVKGKEPIIFYLKILTKCIFRRIGLYKK